MGGALGSESFNSTELRAVICYLTSNLRLLRWGNLRPGFAQCLPTNQLEYEKGPVPIMTDTGIHDLWKRSTRSIGCYELGCITFGFQPFISSFYLTKGIHLHVLYRG